MFHEVAIFAKAPHKSWTCETIEPCVHFRFWHCCHSLTCNWLRAVLEPLGAAFQSVIPVRRDYVYPVRILNGAVVGDRIPHLRRNDVECGESNGKSKYIEYGSSLVASECIYEISEYLNRYIPNLDSMLQVHHHYQDYLYYRCRDYLCFRCRVFVGYCYLCFL